MKQFDNPFEEMARRLWASIVDGAPAPLIIGLALLAVPTVYTLFAPEVLAPATGAKPLSLRLAVGIVWLCVALLAVLRQRSLDARVGRLVSGRFGERNDEITVAVDEVLGALVHSGTHGSPRAFEWTVFTFDAVRGALLPTYPAPRDADIAVLTFKSGNGACGRAFRDGGIVVALGDAASNGEYGLTIEQQARFAKYRSVAAARINWEGRPIGSLTAIAAQEDRYFEGAAGRAILFRLAETVGAVLVAMLGVGTTTQ